MEVASPLRLCHATSTSPLSGTEPLSGAEPPEWRELAVSGRRVPGPTTAQSRVGSPPRHNYSRKSNSSCPLIAPTTVIIGDSITSGIHFFNATTLSFHGATAADIAHKIPSLLRSLPSSISRIIVQDGCNVTAHQQSEQTKCDFKRLLNTLKDCGKLFFISGPLPTVTQNCKHFSRLLSLNSWTDMLSNTQKVHFIDNFNSFWNRPDYFNSDGIHLNRSGRSILVSNIQYSVHTSVQID
ncbi:hypothetical protein D4764_12G0010930 [Xyrichtys novacula]|uniref:SGNH hydrolase-type esterase domain-containing protein n=1 Tax=Xyrichtys novacula TaxID=13765 RepID=A0AAV1EX75_XYRNO|nr:hypothetical protein D4764_12G0010930 [Xyrichtys novacula]